MDFFKAYGREIIEFILAPLIGALGGYYISRYKTRAEANETQAKAMKIKAETDALELDTNRKLIQFYTETMTSLKVEVERHTKEIEKLNKQLNASFDEKRRLALENDDLRKKIDAAEQKIAAQEIEIQDLRTQIADLRREDGKHISETVRRDVPSNEG